MGVDLVERPLPCRSLITDRRGVFEAAALLDHLPSGLAANRVVQALWICVHEAAERERLMRSGGRPLPLAVQAGDLLDGVVGFLQAPASPTIVGAWSFEAGSSRVAAAGQ